MSIERLVRSHSHVPFRFNQISKLKFSDWINGLEVLVQSIKQWDTRRDGHALDVFVANVVDLFDECTNGVGMRDDQASTT